MANGRPRSIGEAIQMFCDDIMLLTNASPQKITLPLNVFLRLKTEEMFRQHRGALTADKVTYFVGGTSELTVETEEEPLNYGPPSGHTKEGIPFYLDDGTMTSTYDGIKRASKP